MSLFADCLLGIATPMLTTSLHVQGAKFGSLSEPNVYELESLVNCFTINENKASMGGALDGICPISVLPAAID